MKRQHNLDMQDIQLITEDSPFEYTEAYKTLRTNFNFMAFNGENRKILVTSAVPDEGKSSVVINLAISLAQIGKRVLVVDGDLRNPSLHRYLNNKKDPERCLSALLTGLNLYNKIARFGGAGTLVPITGFANAVASPALDAKSEGLVLGVGAKIFTVAGPVLLYGVVSGAVWGVIYYAITLFG